MIISGLSTNDNSLSNDNGLCLIIFAEENPVKPKVYPPNRMVIMECQVIPGIGVKVVRALYYIIKGGGFMDSPKFCEITAGYRNLSIDRDCCVGFRLKFEIELK
jgi:hypothetical protein